MDKYNARFVILNIRTERSINGKTYYTLRECGEQDKQCFDVSFSNLETVTKEMLREAAMKHYLKEKILPSVSQGDII